ncbi:MAG TPA: LytR C-terminal domain-containing protein [Acidimicrobiales bacterium]
MWRFGFPGLLLALAAATVVLSIVGAQLVLDSRDGRVGRAELDPTKPGYLATVAPTPTFLVAHVDDGKLLSVVVLALGPNDTGGGAVVLSPNTWVQLEEGADSISLEAIYEQHGIEDVQTGEGLRAAVSTVLRADVDDYVELNARSLAPLIEPVAPLRYTLPDPVRERRGNGTVTVLPAGEVQIDTTDEIIAAIETLGPDEEVIRRTERQQRFWQAWIDAVRAAPDPAQAFPSGSSSTTIARFVRGLAAGEARVDILPYVRFEGILVADRDEIDDLARELIPFPRQEGVRVSVAVYNGVGDLSLNQSVLRQLIGAGAQIVSLGNTPSFGVETTSVAYHDPSLRSQAEALADAIGATDVRFDGKPESDIGVTVTIGADYVAP